MPWNLKRRSACTILQGSRVRTSQIPEATRSTTRVCGLSLTGVAGSNSCRSQWPSGLSRGSAAYRLLGLRVRIPPEAWLFVLCVLHSKWQKAKPGQSGHRCTDIVRTKNISGAWIFVCCFVVSEAKMQESQDKETSTDRVQENTKNPAVSMDFLTVVCG